MTAIWFCITLALPAVFLDVKRQDLIQLLLKICSYASYAPAQIINCSNFQIPGNVLVKLKLDFCVHLQSFGIT